MAVTAGVATASVATSVGREASRAGLAETSLAQAGAGETVRAGAAEGSLATGAAVEVARATGAETALRSGGHGRQGERNRAFLGQVRRGVRPEPCDGDVVRKAGQSSSLGSLPTRGPRQIRTRRFPPSGSSVDMARVTTPRFVLADGGWGAGNGAVAP